MSVTCELDIQVPGINPFLPVLIFQDMVTGDKPHMAFLPGAVPVEGGLPLFVDGQIYGAIGVSGMPSDKDGIVAQAGADFAATLK